MKVNVKSFVFVFLALLAATSCEDPLSEEPFSQIGSAGFFQTESDAVAALNAAYAQEQVFGENDKFLDFVSEFPTDEVRQSGGGLERASVEIQNFTWIIAHPFFDIVWDQYYQTIYRANLIVGRVPDIDMNQGRKQQMIAEGRFLRARSYAQLYYLFGPVPLVTSPDVGINDRPSRPSEEEFVNAVISDFQAAAENLPVEAPAYGRATWGAAEGLLCKFYLNNKMWQEAADCAQEIISSGHYQLFDDAPWSDMFKVENERNAEFIYVRPNTAQPDHGTVYLPHTLPVGFQFSNPPKANFATNYTMPVTMLNTFEADDERLGGLLTEYVNTSGETIQVDRFVHGDSVGAYHYKFPEDPNGVDRWHGNDFPLLRYADILLTRAEALNELNGPNQESIDLINMVRNRAGVGDWSVSDFSSTEELRDSLLAERGREFYSEQLRREDLIRMGKYVEQAQERGVQAFDYHVRYPIPQDEMDKNENLVQNEGYE